MTDLSIYNPTKVRALVEAKDREILALRQQIEALSAALHKSTSVDYAALVAAASQKHGYAQGTNACIAFKHGAEWQALQPAKGGG